MLNTVILDLDDTLFKLGPRKLFYDKNWDRYNSNFQEDELNWDIYEVVKSLVTTNYSLLILTGRYERYRQQTIEQLEGLLPNYSTINDRLVGLVMKPQDDDRSSFHFKTEWIKNHKDSFKIKLVIDDRDDILNYCSSELNLITIKSHNK